MPDKIIALVPKNTMPYRCGERLMACIIKENKLDRCVEFFKTEDEAYQFTQENPEFKWNNKQED